MGSKEDGQQRKNEALAKRAAEGDKDALRATRAHYEALKAAAKDAQDMKDQGK